MKAVVLAGSPSTTLVDVSHAVPPYDVVSGAFVLWVGARHFGPGAVHLAVVDPGVGTARRRVAFCLGGSFYVGPDNGLFGLVVSEADAAADEPDVVELERPPGASATFEGRDVFAPAAAALASGRPLDSLGARSRAPLSPLPLSGPAVLWVDHFGNLVTSLKPPVAALRVGTALVDRVARTFHDAPPATPFLYVGSMGFVEVALRERSAASVLDARVGTPVEAIEVDPRPESS
jgi:S-adenosylmethionine hydrolase